MAKGISIHVGVNVPAAFPESELRRCEDDAKAMFELATAKNVGFTATLLLGPDATFDNVKNAILTAADDLDPGDTFLFTFAGHGTHDVTLDTTIESDGYDESIALADHLLFDNFWRSDLWPSFKPGVRAIAVADCCKAGGVFLILNSLYETLSEISTQPLNVGHLLDAASRLLTRTLQIMSLRKSSLGYGMFLAHPISKPAIKSLVVRRIPEEARRRELETFKEFYAKQQMRATGPITVDRLFLASCEENEDALEGEQHGAFTQALLDIWDSGNFVGNYREFMTAIRSKFSGTVQHPDLQPTPLPGFSDERPFTT